VTWNQANFGPQVLEKARELGAGRLALKAMARGPIPDGQPKPFEKCWYTPLSDRDEAVFGLRWTLSQTSPRPSRPASGLCSRSRCAPGKT
jgi:hypothetical protein